LHGPFEPAFQFDADVRVRVVLIAPDEPGADGLVERVPVRPAALLLVADATVEVVVAVLHAPERSATHGEEVVHQLRGRTVQALHHGAEVVTDLQVPQRVVMVVHQRGHPRDETILGGPVVEAVPEDLLRPFGFEGGKPVGALGRDEVDGVVAIPVFEPMLALIPLQPLMRAFAESDHSGSIIHAGRCLKR
jgi:hypothetical protein